jgi:hypothetical protein
MQNSVASPSTVLISSRVDELGAARRAAFRAVHDAGWIPLLYEVEPDQWLTTLLAAPSDEDRNVLKANRARINECVSIDSLLYKAEHFIGVYGTSLGDPSPQLGGLRPLEYEFLRFLEMHVARKEGVPDPLKHMFPVASSPSNCQDARDSLILALRKLCDPSTIHYAVFVERMAVFLKRHYGDMPASSLMYNTIHKLQSTLPHTLVGGFMATPIELPGGQTVYRRPSSDLYLKIRDRVRAWLERPEPRYAISHQGTPFWVRIRSTDHVGFILAVVDTAFNAGYNVLDVRMGKESPDTRSVYILTAEYLNQQHHERHLLSSLEKHGITTKESPSTDLQPLDSNGGEVWQLETIVANRPGMLARILTALALYHMRVLNVAFPRQNLDDGYSGESRVRIELTFERDSTHADENSNPDQSHLNDPEFALDFIAAELTLLPGFYSVSPARLR